MTTMDTHTMNDDKPGTGAHPLEIIPFLRRWPRSRRRDVVYTVIFSSALALGLAAIQSLAGDGRQLGRYLWSMLVISNLIGFLAHSGLLLLNRFLCGRPQRMHGLPRMLYNVVLMVACVLLGIGLGNLLLSGVNPLKVMADRDVILQCLTIGAVIGVLIYLVRSSAERRVQAALEQARQQELVASSARLLAEARLRALQAQIEPHFLYNTLANVVSLIGPQPARAQHMLERFIDYLRASLAASRGAEATLASEAELLAAYLDVLAVRMGERLRYRIELPDALRGFAIAPMLLQPVVENAISHGLEPKLEGGEIVISARAEAGQVWVEISDTGIGLGASPSSKPGGGVGLSNLRERLRSMYDGAARVELLENQPCGMTVRLMLPLAMPPLTASSTSIPSAP